MSWWIIHCWEIDRAKKEPQTKPVLYSEIICFEIEFSGFDFLSHNNNFTGY